MAIVGRLRSSYDRQRRRSNTKNSGGVRERAEGKLAKRLTSSELNGSHSINSIIRTYSFMVMDYSSSCPKAFFILCMMMMIDVYIQCLSSVFCSLSLLFVRLLCVSPLLCFSRSLFFSIPCPPPLPTTPPLINLHEIDHLQLLIVQYFACLSLVFRVNRLLIKLMRTDARACEPDRCRTLTRARAADDAGFSIR